MKQFIGFNFSKSEVLLNYFKNNPGKWKIDVYLDEEFLHSLFFVFE